jgi:antitoxin VapB
VRTFKKLKAFKMEEVVIENISGSQFIKIPENFKIDDDKVYLKKIGNSIFIIPFHDPWQPLLEGVNLFSKDFFEEREQPIIDKREAF